VGDSGEVVGTYRKVHIPGTVEPNGEGNDILEKRYFTPGDLGFPVVDTGKARVGVQICYDRRFPESFRALGVNGAEIICTPYNTPAFDGDVEKGVDASDMCIRSAAYYNGCFAIGVGKGGVENGVRFIGGSFIAGPSGEVLARAASDGDELVAATVDLEEITTPRKTADRRPAEYAVLAQA
jgi:predicted amidohydrolase